MFGKMLGLHCGSSVYRGMNARKRHARVPRTRSLRGEPASGTNRHPHCIRPKFKAEAVAARSGLDPDRPIRRCRAPLPCFSPNNRGKTLLRPGVACKIAAKNEESQRIAPLGHGAAKAANRGAKRPEQRGQKRQQGSNRVDKAVSEHTARCPFIGGRERQNTLRIWQLLRRAGV
jgi:hypothetical protein